MWAKYGGYRKTGLKRQQNTLDSREEYKEYEAWTRTLKQLADMLMLLILVSAEDLIA